MKKILTVLTITGVCFSSCQKDAASPEGATNQAVVKVTPPAPTVSAVDDTTKGYLRVQLVKDAINTDDILLQFNPGAKAAYLSSEDAVTFGGTGQESLSSLSSDNVKLAINSLPLLSQGTTINLVVNAQSTAVYKLNLTTVNSIPASFDIWLMDKYKKDSLNFRNYPSYAFNLNVSDTGTFGSHRFSIVMRTH